MSDIVAFCFKKFSDPDMFQVSKEGALIQRIMKPYGWISAITDTVMRSGRHAAEFVLHVCHLDALNILIGVGYPNKSDKMAAMRGISYATKNASVYGTSVPNDGFSNCCVCNSGDVIGCFVDFNLKMVLFTLNEKPLVGPLYNENLFEKGMVWAADLSGKDDTVELRAARQPWPEWPTAIHPRK